MSDVVSYGMLKRISWLPNRDAAENGTVIAGQEYDDVEFIGGAIANVTLTDVTINGSATARTETAITAPGGYTVLADDYVLLVDKIIPEITTITLPASPTNSRSLIIKDAAGNAGSFNITIDGNGKLIDGQATQVITTDYESVEIIYGPGGTVQWSVVGEVRAFNGIEGPGVAFDNAIARFNGTSGQILQNTPVLISDLGVVSGASIDTAGALNILKVNGTSLTAVTGTGSVVLATAPTLSNPVVGTQSSGDNSTKAASTAYADAAVSNKALTSAHILVGNVSNVATDVALSGDATLANTGAMTLATVNGNVGSFGSATQSPTFTVNAKGLTTAAANVTITPAVGSITGLGTGVATALAVNVGTAGSPVVNGGALGTPSSGVATNLTGTAAGLTAGNVTTNANLTGAVTSVGNATSLGSFTSAQLSAALTDETGSGPAVFATSPTLVTPALGTPTALVGTNITGTAAALNIGGNAATASTASAVAVGGITGLGTGVGAWLATPSSANLRGALTDETGGGAAVFADAPTFTTGITTPKITFNSTSGIIGTTTNDSAAAGSVGEYISANVPISTTTVTITIASPGVVTWTSHNLPANAPVTFTTTGALPTGITAGTTYYIVGSSITTNTFQIATTIANAVAGTSVNTSGSQSGVQTGTSTATLANATPKDVTAITLTAGNWEVWGLVFITVGATTTTSFLAGWTSPTSITFPTAPNNGGMGSVTAATPASNGQAVTVGHSILRLAGTTTIYLSCQCSFALSTASAYGFVGAKRFR